MEPSARGSIAPSSPADGVRVSVRVRPLNAREQAAVADAKVSWSIDSSSITQCVNTKRVAANSFHFDHVFEKHVTNEQIFSALARPVVTSATDGINGVIFAYGQTAAGKTYTMLGTQSDPGVTRRSIAEVFRLISASPNRQFLLRASYIEIYNEVIRDLLVPDNDNLKIHEDVINKRVFVDSREEVVTSVGQVMDIISRGETVRAVGETNMNDRSSRSHTIFSLKIESREMSAAEVDGEESNNDDGVAVRASTLSLVDLAGSERASFTKAQGMRLVEGGHINKSLLTLGTVINKLSSGEARTSAHIPYRDSKLTRLLQPALGGNARTAVVCAVTPALLHMEETLSTLKFASRAKKVTNQAKTNEFLDDRAKLRRAEKEVTRLKTECQSLKANGGNNNGAIARDASVNGRMLNETRELRLAAFDRKFDVLLETIRASGKASDSATRPLIRNAQLTSPSLTCALDLSRGQMNNGVEESGSNNESGQALAELRKRVFQAEKEKRQALAEINYERQAMIAEVEVLLATGEEAERARYAAEQECTEANSKLASMLMGSMVDEIVTEVMTTSLMSGKLQDTQASLAELGNVGVENDGLKRNIAALRKEHTELVKRDKRGVGPVLKEVKFLQGKLSDLEKKHKAFRQTVTKTASEKAAVERELKDKDRQNRVLHGEIAKHRNHNSKGQARVNKEYSEEKKKFESSVMELKQEASALTAKVAERDEEIGASKGQVATMEREVCEMRLARDKLREANSASSIENSELQRKLECSEAAKKALMDEVDQMTSKHESNVKEMTELTEELGKAHIELEELKSELSEVLNSAESSESDRLAAVSAQQEAEKRFSDMKKARDEAESLLRAESSEKEIAVRGLKGTEDRVSEQTKTIESLEQFIEKYKTAQETSRSQLVQANNEISELRTHVAGLERLNEGVQRSECSECQNLQNQLLSLQEIVSAMEESDNPARDDDNAELRSHISRLEDQNRALNKEVEKLMVETKTRTREVLKLSETIQSRDRKIYAMEDTLHHLGRGEGKIATLEQRCHRRELMIGELNRRLELQEEMVKEGGVPELFKSAERMLELESTNAALLIEQRQHEEIVDRFQKERTAMVEESRKLRDRIKDRDIRRVREVAQRKEAEHDELRRKHQVLRSLPVNGGGQ